MTCQILPFPQEFRPVLPTIVGNVDYATLRQRLEQLDRLLVANGTETDFVQRALVHWTANGRRLPSAEEQIGFQLRARQALRCLVLQTLLMEPYRPFSCQLAGNPLYQWFCHLDALDQIRVPSKSQLQRFAHFLPEKELRAVVDGVLVGALKQPEKIQLSEPLDLEAYFLDTTCLKANIHFPVDWVLLRDGVRTLMKATRLIREAGLRERMEAPEEFLRRVNQLAIRMTREGRRSGGKRARKRTLRELKRLVRVVEGHARRHRELLDRQWERTDWTRPQVEQILGRIDRILELLPQAEKQAHERIIGERPVANDEKLLSLYETEARVIVRGKAGAEVEFGNTLLVGENRQGLILDFELFRESAPADSQLLFRSLAQVMDVTGEPVEAVVTDRGFSSDANSRGLAESGTYDATCPRRPQMLKRRMRSAKFAELQKRRAQTEARIGILKNGFLGQPMRAKGFANRMLAVTWGVLTHNLWMLAKLRKEAPEVARVRPKFKAAA